MKTFSTALPLTPLSPNPMKEAPNSSSASVWVENVSRSPQQTSPSQHRVLEHIAQGTPLPSVLTSLAQYVEAEVNADVKCAIAILDSDRTNLQLRAAPSLSADYVRSLDSLPLGPETGTYGRSVLQNEASFSEDVQNDPVWGSLAEPLSAADIAACWTLPIRNTTQDVIGTLSLHSSEQRLPTSSEQTVAEMASLLGGIAIERNRQHEALQTLRTQLQQLDRCDSAFLGMMNHELRTPLTSILGFASILQDEVPAALKPFVQTIERNGHQLLKHIESVLLALSLKGKAEHPHVQQAQLEPVLQSLVAHWVSEAHVKGIAFRVSQPHTLQPVATDASWVRRILNELLKNAFAFTQDGAITFRVLQTETTIQFEIEDTGVGIDASFLPSVFVPYQQEKMGWDRTHVGIGLGLTIVERMVSKLGGTVRAQSQKGVGSCFTVTLPVQA